MKRLIAAIFVLIMIFSLAACSDDKPETPDTTGGHMVDIFRENTDKSLDEIIDAITSGEDYSNHTVNTSQVEEGVLQGFGKAEIKGFTQGIMFTTNSARNPFIGYVFELKDGTDAEKFKQTLLDNADLNWNGIESADEVIVDVDGNKVVVIITPDDMQQETEDKFGNPVEDELPVYGQDVVEEFAE